MGIIVEDGDGIEGANSYASESDLGTYADDRGITLASGDAEAALIRASTFIDARYSESFPGYRKSGRSQGLQWPRAAAYDAGNWLIPEDEVPKEVFQATCEAAIRELASPNSLLPDLERGGAIQSVRAGSVGITYAHNAPNHTKFSLIDGILANVLNGVGGSSGGLFGKVVRG